MNPTDRRYSREHEWALPCGDDVVSVGITDFAQEQLGDVVYVALPQVGDAVSQHKMLGEIESVKAASDLFAPVSGSVIEVNERLVDNPDLVNQDPFGDGWMVKVKCDSADDELAGLMSAEEYQAFLDAEAS